MEIMDTILIPQLTINDSLNDAFDVMYQSNVSGVLVENPAEPTKARLVHYYSVREAHYQGLTKLSDIKDSEPVSLNLQKNATSLPVGFLFARFPPEPFEPYQIKTVSILADELQSQAYKLSPSYRQCKGRGKHAIPPNSLTPDGKCGVCSAPVS
jgi:hypothetical protein